MSNRVSVSILSGAIILLAIVLGCVLHMHTSLAQAVNDLAYCMEQDVWDCHIERDGLDYNVYFRGIGDYGEYD